ncbi:MAG: right-handed parallel beta-helix repeat-containing protein [Kiritimatiellaeota bacterium]|nr:right-handed parallel beta-helix repeat-containing protein [Kiritimatiellota bacterium]
MKVQYLKRMLIGLGLAMVLAVPWASATNYYVVASSQQPSPTWPWTNWGWAHTNLIEVVAAARDNDTVYVTNNQTYYLTNQVTVSYAITVRSWGPGRIMDPSNTILSGRYPDATNRHFQLTNSGATVAGFTLTKGCESNGGSILLQNGMVTNCTIVSNYAQNNGGNGGGLYIGGSGSGGVWNCVISDNTTSNFGAGIHIQSGGPWQIANCRISGGTAYNYGGGILANSATAGTIISNCWVVSNYARSYSGGIALYNAECHNSFIMGNTADLNQGGGIRIVGQNLLRNCLIANNICLSSSLDNSGGGIAANAGLIQNCTIVSNSVPLGAGGIRLFGSAKFENTIIWGNSGGGTYSNWYITAGASTFTNCCTSPNIVSAFATAVNTITNDPRFVNNATNFQLQSDSPCINAGVNQDWMEGAKDLYGYRRIDNFRKTVDIGAYEYLSKGTVFIGH